MKRATANKRALSNLFEYQLIKIKITKKNLKWSPAHCAHLQQDIFRPKAQSRHLWGHGCWGLTNHQEVLITLVVHRRGAMMDTHA